MKKWLDELEQHLVKWLLGLFTTSIVVAVVFYFEAKYTMAQNVQKIDKLSKEIEKIDNAPSLNTLKINQANAKISEQSEAIKGVQQDLKDFKKQYDTDKDRIINLLFEIKQKIDK